MNPVWHFVNGLPQIGPMRITPSQVLVGDGTAGAPALAFSGETDLGFRRSGTSTVGYGKNANVISFNGVTGTTSLGTDSASLIFGASSDVSLSRGAAGTLTLNSGTATPAGGSTACRLVFGSTAGFGIYIGSGVPTVSAAQGSLYLRSDGSSTSTRAYINNSSGSGTTWTAVTTAA